MREWGGRKRGRGERERENEYDSPFYWFTLQIDALAKVGPVESQASGASSRSPTWLAGVTHTAALLLFQMH